MKLLAVHTAVLLLALPLVALAQSDAPPAAPTDEGPVQFEYGKFAYDGDGRRLVLFEGVVLRRGAVTLRARTVFYDDKTGDVDATGDVILTEPGRVMRADSMHLVLDGPFEATNVVAFYKDQPFDLQEAGSLEAVRVRGRNRLTVTGDRISGKDDSTNRLSIDDARVTMCDCGEGSPSWEIRASHADVIPDERAILSWPVFYITPRFLFIDRPVPVFVLPWLYVPLADRQTGLLVPQIASTQTSQFILAEPVFFNLGRSYDATLTPQYAFGISESDLRDGKRGIRGPGAELELRWAPAEKTSGWFSLRYLHDLARSYRDVGGNPTASPQHGDRVGLSLFHDQGLSDDTRLHVEIGLTTDSLFVSDYTQDVLLRAAEYNRSSISLAHRFDDALLEAEAAYHLSLSGLGQRDFPVDPVSGAPRFDYGTFGSNVPVFHRLPAASATLLPVKLVGPLSLSGSFGIARFAPLRGVTGDEGVDGVGPGERSWGGLPAPGSTNADGQLDGGWDAGERLAATRALVRTELRAPFTLGQVISVEPWVRGTAAGYQFAAGRSAQIQVWGVGGLTLSAELARTYDSTETIETMEGEEKKEEKREIHIRHSIEPRIEWRVGSGSTGPGLPAYAYDDLDVATTAGLPTVNDLPRRPLSALPGGGFDQLRCAVRTRLASTDESGSQSLLDFEVGQDVDLRMGGLSETYVTTSASISPISASALARFRAFGAEVPAGTPESPYPSFFDRFTELRAKLSVADGRGDNVHGSLIALGSGASGRIKAGAEPLFDPRPINTAPTNQATAGVTAKLTGLTATYDMVFTMARTTSGPARLQQQALSLVWDSPCRCWAIAFSLVRDRAGVIQPRISIDLFSGISSSSFSR